MMHNDDKILLHIDLQEVFENDTVVILVNDKEVYNRTGVTTNWSVSLADTLEFKVLKGAVEVTIDLPLRNLSKTVDVLVSEPIYLRVKLIEDTLDIDISNKRSFYF